MNAVIVTAIGPAVGWGLWRVTKVYAPDAGRAALIAIVLATTAAFAAVALTVTAGWIQAASLVLAAALVCLAAIDLMVMRLPDVITLPLLVLGLAVSAALPGSPILGHLAGAAVGYLLLAGLAWAWRRWRGVDAIGAGDAKLLAAGGAWLGWSLLPMVLIVACASAFVLIAVRLARRGRSAAGEPIAFGAPLALAILIVWLYGSSSA